HENWEIRRGGNYTPITKADANGKTAFIHRIRYDTETKQLRIESVLEVVDGAIEEDSATAAVVDRWIDLAWRGFREAGFDAARPIATIPVALDGTAVVNNRPTNLTELIAAAMAREVPQGDLVVFNAGSIRIDDHLAPGVLTEYDVLRTLPFGGLILSVGMKGDLLERVLDQGMANRGSGGFLQTRNVERRDGSWWIGPERLSPDRVYTVAIADFLMTGRERGLSFLTRDHPSVVSVEAKGDVRKAVIAELQRRWGARDERRGARGERRGARDERRGTRDERLLKTWALTGE
ncbi:MAG TPA: 5'-nucleotidase, partial [Thermoanaerobaculia bacterium]|nr:5'-nucleotidase [Thermoanaerobaculia bacterium]